MEINNIQSTENKGKQEPMLTAEEMLGSVDSAIVAVASGGQSYKIGSRELARANLKDLYNIKNDLTERINSDNDSHLLDKCYVGVFSGR